MLFKAEGELHTLLIHVATLFCLCITLLAVNCYISRKCQHRYALLHGLATDGALVVIPQPEEAPSTPAKKATLFLGSASVVELLSPTTIGLSGNYAAGLPFIAEALVFILICLIITKLSADLGKAHNKRLLSFNS